MRFVRIDGMNVAFDMDRINKIEWSEPSENGFCYLYIDGKSVGRFDDIGERDRVIDLIFEAFPPMLHIDERGYKVNKDKELWQ